MGDARRFVGVRLAPAGYDYVQHVAARDKVTFSEALRRLLTAGATTDWETHANGHRSGPHDRAERGAATRDVRSHEHPDRHFHGDRRSDPVPSVPQPDPTDRDDPAGGWHSDICAGCDACNPSDTSGPSHPRDSTSGSDHPDAADYPPSDADRVERFTHLTNYPSEDATRTA